MREGSALRSRNLFLEIVRTLTAYVGGQILIALIVSCLYLIGFGLLGVPLWFLLALVCGFLHLIPQFGAAIAIPLGLTAALLGGLGLERTLGVLGVFVFVFTLEGYVLSPVLLGRRLRLRPLYIFLATLLGGSMFGFVGLLLAVPALAVMMVIYHHFAERA